MKIKGDFITNSSSSSFIVAMKGDVTLEDIVSYYRQEIFDFINDEEELDYFYDDAAKEIKDEPDEEKRIKIFAREILKEFKSYHPLVLDEWHIDVHHASNEDGEMIPSFFYCGGDIKKDNLIVHRGYD